MPKLCACLYEINITNNDIVWGANNNDDPYQSYQRIINHHESLYMSQFRWRFPKGENNEKTKTQRPELINIL